MDVSAAIRIICLFIVAYIFFQVGRWIVLPHLKIFPYIPPQFLWTTLYSIAVYVFNMLFHWILIALVIIWIIWNIIKKYVPDFIIPFKTILLNLSPFKPLENAGVFGLMDNVSGIISGGASGKDKLFSAGGAIGGFLSQSGQYLLSSVREMAPAIGSGPNISVTTLPPENRSMGKGSTNTTFFTEQEINQVNQEYDRCVMENTAPIHKELNNFEKMSVMTKNNLATTRCRLKTFEIYSSLTQYRDF